MFYYYDMRPDRITLQNTPIVALCALVSEQWGFFNLRFFRAVFLPLKRETVLHNVPGCESGHVYHTTTRDDCTITYARSG